MAKPRKRQINIKYTNNPKEVSMSIKFSTEDQDAGVTAETVLKNLIEDLKNLETTGKIKPVVVDMDNIKDE
jgi:hypothetical protein